MPTEETASNLLKVLQPSQGASLTTKKALFVMERGFQVSGLILVHPETHQRILIEASAVITLENEKMWELFHH